MQLHTRKSNGLVLTCFLSILMESMAMRRQQSYWPSPLVSIAAALLIMENMEGERQARGISHVLEPAVDCD